MSIDKVVVALGAVLTIVPLEGCCHLDAVLSIGTSIEDWSRVGAVLSIDPIIVI